MEEYNIKPYSRKEVFISSTTQDLGECRSIISEIILKSGMHPVVQDYFAPDPRTIESIIGDSINKSDAVICLIGHYCGAIPHKSEFPGLSYTQIEYKIARELRKPVFLFIASDQYPYATSLEEGNEKRDLQKKFRESILFDEPRYEEFSSIEELIRKIHLAINPLLTISASEAITYIDNPPMPAYFVGRHEELAQLKEAIYSHDPAIIVILGMGGQGKSTLLAHIIKNLKYFPFKSGIWISANRGGSSFGHLLNRALENFSFQWSRKPKDPSLERRLEALMDCLQKQPLLIVLDGVESWLKGWAGIDNPDKNTSYTLESRRGIYYGFDKFLEQCSGLNNGSHLILTSRALPAALEGVKLSILPVLPEKEKFAGLKGLLPHDALNLLKSMGLVASDDKLEEIASRFFYHPLSITGFASLAKKVGKKWEDLLIPRGIDAIETLRNLLLEIRKHLPNSLISHQLIKLASLSIDNTPFDLLKWLWYFDELSKNESEGWLLQQVIMLSEWSIFSWDPETMTISFHPLIKEHFSQIEDAKESKIANDRIGAFYNSSGFIEQDYSLEGAKNKILAVKHYLLSGNLSLAIEIMFGSEFNSNSLYSWFVKYGHLWECAELISEIASYCPDELKAQCVIARASVLNDLDLLGLAREDIDLAISFYEKPENKKGPVNLQNLAKAYGTKGVLFLERNKAKMASLIFTSALDCLRLASSEGIIDHMDLARTFINRGLAYKVMGDFITAKNDFTKALDQLNLCNNEYDEIKKLRLEISIQIIRLKFAEGNIYIPLTELLELINQLTNYQDNEIRMLDRNYLMSVLFLGYAWNVQLNPLNAIETLNKVIIPLKKLDSEGLRNIRGILALGLVNRSQSYCLLGNYQEAMEDITIAKSLYYDHIKGDRVQFKGQLSNALFQMAKLNYFLNRPEEGRVNLQEAAQIGHEWIIKWFEESDIKIVFLNNAIESLSFADDSHIPERKLLLEEISLICDRLVKSEQSFYLTALACAKIAKYKGFLIKKAQETGFDLPHSFFMIEEKETLLI